MCEYEHLLFHVEPLDGSFFYLWLASLASTVVKIFVSPLYFWSATTFLPEVSCLLKFWRKILTSDTAWERPVNPHNISCVNTYIYLILKPGTFKFVAIPSFANVFNEWVRFATTEICTIHCKQCPINCITSKSIFKPNLKSNKTNIDIYNTKINYTSR